MVVGKGIPNPLITKSLLKILRNLIPPSPPKFLINFLPWNGRTTKICIHFLSEMITDRTCHVNIIPLTVKFLYPQRVKLLFVNILTRNDKFTNLLKSQNKSLSRLKSHLWQWNFYLLIIFNRMTGPPFAQMTNPITIMLNITTLTVNKSLSS